MSLRLIPFTAGAADTGSRKTKAYEEARDGLMVPPIKVGSRAYMGEHERDAMVRARLAGATDEEIRALVQRLIEQRKGAA